MGLSIAFAQATPFGVTHTLLMQVPPTLLQALPQA